MSPRGLDRSQRPFVWIRSRISPSASAVPQGVRSSSTGMWPYGICAVRDPLRADHAREADVDDAPLRLHVEAHAEADRKIAAPASSHTGQTGREARGGRSRRAIQTQRASR